MGAARQALAAVALALAALPAAGAEAAFNASARLNVVARSGFPGAATGPVAGDAELLPSLEGLLLWGRVTRLSVAYSPSLLVSDLQGLGNAQTPATPVVLHRGRFNLTTTFRHIQLSLNQDAAYGETQITGLRLPEGAVAGAVPELTALGVTPYVRSSSSLMLSGDIGRLWAWGLTGAYVISGDPSGLDASYALRTALGGNDQGPVLTPRRTLLLPFQFGPMAQGYLRARVAPFHSLGTYLTFMEARFQHLVQGPRDPLPLPEAEQLVAQATEMWEGRLSPSVTATLGGGVAFSHERIALWQVGSIPGDYAELLPVAQGTLAARLQLMETQAGLTASLRLGPYADRLTGLVYERVEARVAGEWRPTRRLTTAASVSGAYSVGVGRHAQPGDFLTSVDVTAEWALDTWVSLAGLARALYYQQRDLTTGNVAGNFQWMATMSVIVRYHGSTAW